MKNVAVVGASGAVGERMIRLLEERRFPLASIKFLASERSAGKSVMFRGESHPIASSVGRCIRGRRDRALEHAGVRLAAVEPDRGRGRARSSSTTRAPSAWTPTSRWSSPRSTRTTSSSTAGSSPTPTARRSRWSSRSSRCTTLPGSGGSSSAPISRSRAPAEGHSRARIARPRPTSRTTPCPAPSKFAHPILGNCIPQIDDFLPNGYTKEEMKMVNETRKIMGDAIDRRQPDLRAGARCRSRTASRSWSRPSGRSRPRKPARSGRDRPGRDGRRRSPGTSRIRWPPRPPARTTSSSAGSARTCSRPNALLFWCVSDNLRKGAATNAVQIAEKLLELVPRPRLSRQNDSRVDAEHQAHPLLRRHRLPRLAAPAGLRTVQQVLEEALEQLTGAAVRPRPPAAGPTPASTRWARSVHFLTASRHSTETFVRALNALLPRDVRVLDAREMPQAFHATLDAKSKRYRYVIDNGRIASPFQLRYSWHVRRPLDVDAMDRGRRSAPGPARLPQLRDRLAQPDEQRPDDPRPDASSARSDSSRSRSRPTASCTIWSARSRGRWCWVGQRQAPARSGWREVLAAENRVEAGPTAPPQGLFLVAVRYDPESMVVVM